MVSSHYRPIQGTTLGSSDLLGNGYPMLVAEDPVEYTPRSGDAHLVALEGGRHQPPEATPAEVMAPRDKASQLGLQVVSSEDEHRGLRISELYEPAAVPSTIPTRNFAEPPQQVPTLEERAALAEKVWSLKPRHFWEVFRLLHSLT